MNIPNITFKDLYNKLLSKITILKTNFKDKKGVDQYSYYNDCPTQLTPTNINKLKNNYYSNDNNLYKINLSSTNNICSAWINYNTIGLTPLLSANGWVSGFYIFKNSQYVLAGLSSIQQMLENHEQRLYDLQEQLIPSPEELPLTCYVLEGASPSVADGTRNHPYSSIQQYITWLQSKSIPKNTTLELVLLSNLSAGTFFNGNSYYNSIISISHKDLTTINNSKLIIRSDNNNKYTIWCEQYSLANEEDHSYGILFDVYNNLELKDLILNVKLKTTYTEQTQTRIKKDKIAHVALQVQNNATVILNNIEMYNFYRAAQIYNTGIIHVKQKSILEIKNMNKYFISDTTDNVLGNSSSYTYDLDNETNTLKQTRCICIEAYSILKFIQPFQLITYNCGVSIVLYNNSFIEYKKQYNISNIQQSYISCMILYSKIIEETINDITDSILPECNPQCVYQYKKQKDEMILTDINKPAILNSTLYGQTEHIIYSNYLLGVDSSTNTILNLSTSTPSMVKKVLNITDEQYNTIKDYKNATKLSTLIPNNILTNKSLYFIALNNTNSCIINNLFKDYYTSKYSSINPIIANTDKPISNNDTNFNIFK